MGFILEYESAEHAYKDTISKVRDFHDFRCQPRGQMCIEKIGHSFRIHNPRDRVIFNKERNINFSFMVAEWLWIMSGSDDVKMISHYNSKIADYSDDGKTMHGAYGKRILRKDQLSNVIEKLREDNDSRQALMIIFEPEDVTLETKDVPCTILFQFFIRDNKLHMVTYMRSNDVLLGLPYDLFNFTMIQEYVLTLLREESGDFSALGGLGMGTYTHTVGSLHIYERDFGKIEKISAEYSEEIHFEKKNVIMNMMEGNHLDWLITSEKDLRENNFDKATIKAITGAPNDYWKNLFYFLALRSVKDDPKRKKALKEMICIFDPYFKKLIA